MSASFTGNDIASFTGNDLVFPVEMLISVIEVQAQCEGLEDASKAHKLLNNIPEDGRRQAFPAIKWKEELIENGWSTWDGIKNSLLDQFQTKVPYTVDERVSFLQSAVKKDEENFNTFWMLDFKQKR